MRVSTRELEELLGRENVSLRCWKCLQLIKTPATLPELEHECWREARGFVVKEHGDLRGNCGELFSIYPLDEEEGRRLDEESKSS